MSSAPGIKGSEDKSWSLCARRHRGLHQKKLKQRVADKRDKMPRDLRYQGPQPSGGGGSRRGGEKKGGRDDHQMGRFSGGNLSNRITAKKKEQKGRRDRTPRVGKVAGLGKSERFTKGERRSV